MVGKIKIEFDADEAQKKASELAETLGKAQKLIDELSNVNIKSLLTAVHSSEDE